MYFGEEGVPVTYNQTQFLIDTTSMPAAVLGIGGPNLSEKMSLSLSSTGVNTVIEKGCFLRQTNNSQGCMKKLTKWNVRPMEP